MALKHGALIDQSKKKYKKFYKQGLTTKPDPDVLTDVDYDDPAFKDKDGYIDIDKTREVQDQNEAIIRGWDDQAKSTGAWVGRTLTDSVADGYAIYVVIKENKKTVRIKVCRGLGDDWVSRHFGEECTIPKDYAEEFLPWDFTNGRVVPN